MCDDSRFGRCANHRNDVEPNIGMNICHAYEGVGSYRQRVYLLLVYGSHGIGKALIEFAVSRFGANHLWALEKNARAIAFYGRHDFLPTGKRKFEEGTTEYLVELRR